MYWRKQDLWDPVNLVALMIAELNDTPPYLTDVIGIVCGPATDARRGIAWNTCTRVRWARVDSLIVIVNCGHLWSLCDSRVSCCQVISLARCVLIQISTTPSDMGEACSLCSNVVMKLHYVDMRMMMIMLTTC
jgi:hypothetical protein